MKQRTVYWLPSIRGMVLLSALLMTCSGLIRAVWAIGEAEMSMPIFLFQVLLPLWANLCFVWILFLDGRERLYRSAIPVWLGCVFFAVKAFYFVSILHTVLCLLLYALVAVLYTATVVGVIRTQVFLWPLFGLPMLYHIFVEDRQKIGWTFHEWLPELSVLCCMAALLCLSLAMRRRPMEEGGLIRRFGETVQAVKETPLDSSFDKLADAFNLIPGLLLRGLVALLQAGDYLGLLPRRLTKLSPFHGSLYITSKASLGIPPIHHHLYDFGNVPVFCSFGKKHRVYETRRDGSVALRKYVDCNFVTDERIVDGFYYASAIRYIHGLMNDPWQLDRPPETVNQDQL